MQLYKNKKLRKVVAILILIIIGSFGLNYFLSELTSDEARNFIIRLGFWGPLVIIIYIIFSHILAPLAGSPALLLSLAIYGLSRTMFYSYIASMISAVICFFISRKLGRMWVGNLSGGKFLAKVDEFTEYSGTELLIFSRLLGFLFFEIISYAAGLTNISFRRYFIITSLVSILPHVAFAYFLRNVDFTSIGGIAIWFGALFSFGFLFSIFVKVYISRKRHFGG